MNCVMIPYPHTLRLNRSFKLPLNKGMTAKPGAVYIEGHDTYLLIQSRSSREKINLDRISYIKASSIYSIIYYEDTYIVSSRPIRTYEHALPVRQFTRCHHSYIINKSFISSVKRGRTMMIHLPNDIKVPVSIKRRNAFLEWLDENAIVI